VSVVDASVWVSLLAADDVNHAATQLWFERQIAAGADFLAPTLVLVEVAGAMARRTGDASAGMRAADRVRRLPGLELVALTVDDAEQAASLAARVALRGADAVYAALASARDRRLVTWDRQQRERSATAVQVSSPDDELGQH
jgi:predicted nucleic acid-binding protein